MRKKTAKFFGFLALGSILVLGKSAFAANAFGIPDTDTAALVSMLATLGVMSENTRETVELAQETISITEDALDYAKTGVEAAAMVRNAITNPEDFMRSEASYFMDFYGVNGVRNDLEDLQNDVSNFSDIDGTYDPYAFRDALSTIAESTVNGKFSAVTRIMDAWGFSDPHEAVMAELSKVRSAATDLEAKVLAEKNKLKTHTKKAADITADATVLTAEATSSMNKNILELVRIAEEQNYHEQVMETAKLDSAAKAMIKRDQETELHLQAAGWGEGL